LSLWDRDKCTNFADNSRNYRQIIIKFLRSDVLLALLVLTRIIIRIQGFLTKFLLLSLQDRGICKTFVGSATLVMGCGLRVLLVFTVRE